MRVFGLMIGIFIGIAQAEWTVSTASGLQLFPLASPDQESKGAFISFTDMRPTRHDTQPHGYELYLQHIDSIGNKWGNDVPVSFPYAPDSGGKSQQHGHRLSGVMCEGSPNGNSVILCWVNHHKLNLVGGDSAGIYCEKVNKYGQLLWDGDIDKSGKQPVKVTTASKNPPAIAPCDGGVVCAWLEKSGREYKIMAKRLDSNGNPHPDWETNPVTVRSDPSDCQYPKIIPTSGGGCIIVWSEYTDHSSGQRPWLWAQKLTSTGNCDSSWGSEGKPIVCLNGTNKFHGFEIAEDLTGGVLVAWRQGHKISGTYEYDNVKIRCEQLDEDGIKKWGSNTNNYSAVLLCTQDVNNLDVYSLPLLPPVITNGTTGQGIIVWSEKSSHWKLCANKVDTSGKRWGENNVTVSGESGDQLSADIISDNGGGCILCWKQGNGSSADIWANRLSSIGQPYWSDSKGVQICGDGGFQGSPRLTLSDSQHSIITWDSKDGWDIYAKKIDISTGE